MSTKEKAAAKAAENVWLATWEAPGNLIAWGEVFESGVQREVSAELAKKMKGVYTALDLVHTTAGSEDDVRVEIVEVPPQTVEESDAALNESTPKEKE